MATYQAIISVPTANIANVWAIEIYYPTTSYSFGGATETLAQATSGSVAGINAALTGTTSYTSTLSGTDTIYRVLITAPTLVPTSITFENVTQSDLYNDGFTAVDSCSGCVSVQWSQCEDEYEIDLGLTASTMYNYTMTHPLTGVEYTQNTTTTNQGVTVWDATTYPELYTVGNVFVLTATTTGGAEVSFNYNGTEYSCVQITIVNQTSVYP